MRLRASKSTRADAAAARCRRYVAIVAALVLVAVPTLPAAEVWDKPYDRQSYIAFVAMLLT